MDLRPTARRSSVLVAEGDPAVRESALALLRQLGVSAEAVADGEAAVRSVVAAGPDVVLLGVRLPLMSGVEAMKSIRGILPAERRPRVVALAAGPVGGTPPQLLAAGFDAVCSAPLTAEALAEAIGTAPEADPAADLADDPADAALAAQVRAHVTDLIGEDDPEFVAELVATFAESSRGALDAAGAALVSGDARGVGAAAHQLRGSASNIGLTSLVALWTTVEDAVRLREADGLETAPVEHALAETQRAIGILAGVAAQAA